MLEKTISTKQDLIRLLQGADIKKVIAKDIHKPEDLNEVKKSALSMIQSKLPITVFIVSGA